MLVFDMFRDNVPTMMLSSWDLECSLYDGETTAGPVPTLFAEEVEVAKEAITADPSKAHSDYLKIARTFFMPETIGIEDAVAMVKKPR